MFRLRDLMTTDVHRVLVVDKGRLLGVVTTMGVARGVADPRSTTRTYASDRAPVERDHDRGAS